MCVYIYIYIYIYIYVCISNHYVIYLKLIHCHMSIIVQKKEWVLGKGWEIKGRRPTTLKEQQLGPQNPGRKGTWSALLRRTGMAVRWGGVPLYPVSRHWISGSLPEFYKSKSLSDSYSTKGKQKSNPSPNANASFCIKRAFIWVLNRGQAQAARVSWAERWSLFLLKFGGQLCAGCGSEPILSHQRKAVI